MKKLISVILAGVMMAGLCACGKGTSAKETQENAKETTKETIESETEETSSGQTESDNPNLLLITKSLFFRLANLVSLLFFSPGTFCVLFFALFFRFCFCRPAVHFVLLWPDYKRPMVT